MNIPREFPRPSISIFLMLQLLDILTTLIGIRLGAQEANTFVSRLLSVQPVAGLFASKLVGVFLICMVILSGRQRLIVFLNLWYAGVVSWNLGIILLRGFGLS